MAQFSLTFTADDVTDDGPERLHAMVEEFVATVRSMRSLNTTAQVEAKKVTRLADRKTTALNSSNGLAKPAAPARKQSPTRAPAFRSPEKADAPDSRDPKYYPPSGLMVVPGTNWHKGPGEAKQQARARIRLYAAEIMGQPIGSRGQPPIDVVRVYEHDLFGNRRNGKKVSSPR